MHRASQDAFDTTGAFLKKGRWHSAGIRILYSAQYASLAVLETLVNVGGPDLPGRAMTRIIIPDSCFVEHVPWMDEPHSRRFGDAWIQEERCAVLAVPSIVVNKMELNFLLNPAHSDFNGITHESAQEFVFDPRFGIDTL